MIEIISNFDDKIKSNIQNHKITLSQTLMIGHNLYFNDHPTRFSSMEFIPNELIINDHKVIITVIELKWILSKIS